MKKEIRALANQTYSITFAPKIRQNVRKSKDNMTKSKQKGV